MNEAAVDRRCPNASQRHTLLLKWMTLLVIVLVSISAILSRVVLAEPTATVRLSKSEQRQLIMQVQVSFLEKKMDALMRQVGLDPARYVTSGTPERKELLDMIRAVTRQFMEERQAAK